MSNAHQTAPNSEPLIHELLNDPITELLMQTDGVERTMLDPLLQDIMHKVSSATHKVGAPAASVEVA